MIDPVADLARGKSYTVTIPADAVRDAGGLPNQAYSFSFRTPFSVILTDPANNETKVAVDKTITVTLSEAGVQGPNFSSITLKAGATTIQSAISINGERAYDRPGSEPRQRHYVHGHASRLIPSGTLPESR